MITHTIFKQNLTNYSMQAASFYLLLSLKFQSSQPDMKGHEQWSNITTVIVNEVLLINACVRDINFGQDASLPSAAAAVLRP